MKKTLALVLALAMVFSSITVAFAEEAIGADAQIAADLGMLKGETGTVDAAYVATAPTRLQAAVMFLRLKGYEAEALAFTGEDNFVDGNIAWAEGSNLIAYLKANPQLGWIGDGTNFNPNNPISAKEYYKVLLEALGYKQTVDGVVVGDFTWDNVLEFAAGLGLSKVAAVTNFTVNDLAVATVEALKLNVKDSDKTLVATLVEAGKIDEAKAAAAGLIADKAAKVAVAVDEAIAVGSAVVEVTFEDDVDAAAAGNVANYAIEGLEINAAVVAGSDRVLLETAAMTSGKLYKLTVGEQTVQFTGIAKVSGGPEIDKAISEDVEEVVITFTKNIDFVTGSDVANYSIAGVEVVSAVPDGNGVTLTTEGLKNKTKYTVKVTSVKSVDGVTKKSDSYSFTSKYDLVAPKIVSANAETNQRLVVLFNEKVTEESASDLANYSIKVDETDGAELEILEVKFITSGDDKEKKVELITEAMEKREDYELAVSNIADKRKVANVMTRPNTEDFEGAPEDETEPDWEDIWVLSPTTILVEFSDASRFDEASATDTNNYTLEDLDIESIETVKNEWQVFRALLTVEEMETGKTYDLTIVDVLDEFGNALDETTKPAKGISSNFASAKLLTAVADGENTITLTFDKEIDETSAENLANYDIDEEVGAPTKATLEDDGVTVTLEVNDIVNGYGEYDLVVDGVEDLAGNELYFKKKVDTTTKWNNAAPELEDADIVNEYVVALSFDERVEFAGDARLILAYDLVDSDDDGDVDSYSYYELPANDLRDDDTVVEFSDGAALPEDEAYTVVGVVYGTGDFADDTADDGGVTDLVGNPVLMSDIEFGKFEFEGIEGELELAEVDTYEQVNATTFEVTMTRDVVLSGGAVQNGFTVEVDSDDNSLVTFTKNDGIIQEDYDYSFSFDNFLDDKHGFPVDNADSDTLTYLTGEYEDKDAPYIDEVVAKDRWTIKVVFSEDIPVDAADSAVFTLKNYDLDTTITISALDGTAANNTASDDDGDNTLYLTVGKPLESRYEYELTLDDLDVADYAGLYNEDVETIYFNGTNLAK